MNDLQQKADRFQRLHQPGRPLVLCNVWDAGSAKAVEAAGAAALATSSWSVAAANGYKDGEQLPRETLLATVRAIARCTRLPLSIDIESGYGPDPADVRRTVELTIEAGAIGCNLEDSYPADGSLRSIPEQVERIRQARKSAEAAGIDYFINARCDLFFTKAADENPESLIKAAIERATAYGDAGATGFFVPGLAREDLISELAGRKILPINIMLGDMAAPTDTFSKLGVARISYGPAPYLAAMKALGDLARKVSA